jgi:ATP/maltotriose-dependent transcriptional regulator MalT
VSRPGLWERLRGSARVTVLSAPPGSGKTVLLRSWIGESGLGERAAWVVVGRDERDPQRAGPGGYAGTGASPRLAEPLSHSELRVLRYLPTHLSAPEIAGELSVSPSTVKTHMRNLYAKLDGHSRAEAVERARALGLLAPSAHR